VEKGYGHIHTHTHTHTDKHALIDTAVPPLLQQKRVD
jgi:hypothetical protein